MPSGVYKRTAKMRENMRKSKKGHKVSKRTRDKIRKWRTTTFEGRKTAKRTGKLGAKNRWKGHIKQIKKPTKKMNPPYTIEKKRFTNQRYRARKREAEGLHTFGEWELLKRQYGYTCPACGKSEPEIKLTEDHIVPLSKGGSDWIENIQPLCVSCNTRKHAKSIKFPIRKGVKKHGR